MKGRKFPEGRRLEAEVSTRIRIRYRSGLVPEMRGTWDSHTYGVVAVIEKDSRRREFWLMCNEVL